jgi:S-adenosylmethionine decarboxylase
MGMRLNIIVATLEGCPFDRLDDPRFIDHLLREAVHAGGFTLLHTYVHEFEPQGVTGAAILSESHIAIHTWPENGTLFVDIATCSGDEATQKAFDRICELIPHREVRRQHVDYSSKSAAGPSTLQVRRQASEGLPTNEDDIQTTGWTALTLTTTQRARPPRGDN